MAGNCQYGTSCKFSHGMGAQGAGAVPIGMGAMGAMGAGGMGDAPNPDPILTLTPIGVCKLMSTNAAQYETLVLNKSTSAISSLPRLASPNSI
jgi:hypothetical protein